MRAQLAALARRRHQQTRRVLELDPAAAAAAASSLRIARASCGFVACHAAKRPTSPIDAGGAQHVLERGLGPGLGSAPAYY